MYNGKQSPAPISQQGTFQNPQPGTYGANGYPQGAHPNPSTQMNASPGHCFQPFVPPQHSQAQEGSGIAQDQSHVPQGKRTITPASASPHGPGGQPYNTLQPYGQIQPQPQPTAPIVFQAVPNHPHLTVSSAPVRYRAKAGRAEAVFTPVEHVFKTEPPKPKTAGTRKTSSTKEAEASSSSESEEEEEDGETELDREAVKIMIKMGVPKNTPEAVEQQVVQRVWQDQHTAYDKDKTSKAIQWFGTFVDGFWVEVKRLKDSLKTAEENGEKDKIPSLQAAARRQNEMMHTAIQTAERFGEEYLVSNMGGNRKLCTIMRNALANCFTTKDFTGPYPRVLLKLMSRFTTIDTEFLSKLKLDALRTKYGEQIDSEMKGYIDQIIKNAKIRDEKTKPSEANKEPKKAATRPLSADPAKKPLPPSSGAPKVQAVKKEVETKKLAPEIKKIDYSGLGSARKLPNGAPKPAINGSPIKRPRDDDPDSRTAKKVAVEGSAGAPTTKASNANVSAPAGPGAQQVTASAKPKPSATILPGKSRTIVKPVTKRPEPAAPSAFSSISGLLAEIAKPKEAPKAREEPERAPETPEETARRLRKEKRRKLRVVWKPDDQLEEVRIFTHDAAEDEGRGTNMLRDARDNRSEGQMLKMGIRDDEDDAEDDGKPRESSLREWVVPNMISFDQIGEAQRDKSFVSRGGVKDISSEQRKFMEEYESRELMAVYTTAAEIPETPRSPPQRALSEMETTPKVAVLPSDTPKMQEVHRRWAEFGQYGPVAAQQLALSRLGLDQSGSSKAAFEQSRPSTALAPAPRFMTQEERDEAVLTLLRSDAVKNWKDPTPFDPANPRTQRRNDYADPKLQEAADAIEAVCEKFRGKPYPPTEPPEHITAPDRAREWWAGHERDVASRAVKDAKTRAKALADEHARNAAVAKAAQEAQAAAQAAAPAAGSNDMAAWAAYFAQAQGQQQQGQSQDPAYAAILQQVQALQSGQQQPAQPAQATANDVQSLLAALGGQTASASQPQGPVDPAAAAWAAHYQNQTQAQTQAQPDQQAAWAAYYAQFGAQAPGSSNNNNATSQEQNASGSNHPSRQHEQYRDHENDRNPRHHDNFSRDRDRASRHHGGKDRGGGSGSGGDRGGAAAHKGINRALIGTKPCSFWAKGLCAKGDQCTFRHDPNDLK
ncbi:uncharacterized protein B0I36DRAFT_329134 [Microdochium trichocladiopsis]|uniref:C3H1-type domain-containing protein n=1 Tax=Microdochium trichocladiopsis TaxID=1682393 RepID=A0A9P8XZ47_9PEZI|nr:uncharacterized protein B0I36DRAFT_329134 [Microdochium trichocladiopsis]KAH7025788.1 hypothetical protein B0I36DRAFT_329134 [Microdochium trichocladiopsis]